MTIGRVPLLYYVAHLYLLHVLQRVVTAARYGSERSPGFVNGLAEALAAELRSPQSRGRDPG